MSVKFTVKVVGDIPANRLCILGGRDENDVILLKIADRTHAVDFVSTRALKDGEITEVELKDGINVWQVETSMDVLSGQWLSCREDGKAGARTGGTLENIGFTLEPAKAGEVVKMVRRESFEGVWGIEVNSKLADLEERMSALEGGGGQ